MVNLKEIQERHKKWEEKNFPTAMSHPELSLLGMAEEVGEFCHSVLKRTQGIRVNEDHDEKIKDAIGDIIMFSMGYFNKIGIDSALYYPYDAYILSTDVGYALNITRKLGKAIYFYYENNFITSANYVYEIYMLLKGYCKDFKLDFDSIVEEIMTYIEKRDWTKDKNNGGI